MIDHDRIVDGRVVKVPAAEARATDAHPTTWPHGSSCPGCVAEELCHVCGGHAPRRDRCVSAACPTCCNRNHRHSRG